jgi:PTS system galactitol-specific IIA component
VGLLADSVTFGVMGTPDQVIPVQVVFLLVVTDPKQQVRWLKQLVEFFQQPQHIRQIQAAASPSDLAKILRGHLFREDRATDRNESHTTPNQ